MSINIIKRLKAGRNGTNAMILFLGASNMISNAFTIVSGILVARWILPETLGQFTSYSIFSSYIILAQVGIPIALGRELPFYIGRGEKNTAEKYAAVSQFYALSLGILVLLVTFLLALVFLFQKNYEAAAGSVVVGILSFQGFYVTQYLKMLYRGNRDFNKLSIINIITSFVTFGGIVFVYYWGFYGLCLRSFVHFVILLSLTYIWRPTKVQPRFQKQDFLHLLRLGFPMYMVTNVYALWPILQKTMILALAGKKVLGLYALAIMVQGAMVTISGSLSSVTYPTMAREWGKGATVGELFKLALKPVIFAGLIFMFIIPIGWLALPFFVEWLIPNYIEGVEAARWMMITIFIGLFNVWTNIYNVVNHQRQKLFSFLGGMGAWFITLNLLYKFRGFSLEIFPQSMAVGFFFILLYNLFYIKKNKRLTY